MKNPGARLHCQSIQNRLMKTYTYTHKQGWVNLRVCKNVLMCMYQNSMKRNSERSKQKTRLLECFTAVYKGFKSTFFACAQKNICSTFTAAERCQIDSPRDWVSLYTQTDIAQSEKVVPLPKRFTIHSLCNSLHTTEPLLLLWKC